MSKDLESAIVGAIVTTILVAIFVGVFSAILTWPHFITSVISYGIFPALALFCFALSVFTIYDDGAIFTAIVIAALCAACIVAEWFMIFHPSVFSI